MENNDTLEVIQRIPLDKLRPYPDHPFGVRDDDMMQQTVESIKQFGVLVPGIARPLPDGTFELIAGHRRKQASAVAGLDDMPIIVRDIDRNAGNHYHGRQQPTARKHSPQRESKGLQNEVGSHQKAGWQARKKFCPSWAEF